MIAGQRPPVVDTATRHYLLDLENGLALSPDFGVSWTDGGEFDERRIAWTVGEIDAHDELRAACPWCRTRRGNVVLHTHGADSDVSDGVYGHRVGSGPGECSRRGYVVIDRAQLERHLETRDAS